LAELAEPKKSNSELLDICQKYNIHLKNDLLNLLIRYGIRLRNEKFEKDFHHIDLWKDFRIPLFYHYFLNTEQLRILGAYFHYIPQKYTLNDCFCMRYYLNSNTEYETFLTIPYQFRKYLTYLPRSEITHKKQQYINPTKTLLIHPEGKNPKEKLILG
jgi:hypothetical protein